MNRYRIEFYLTSGAKSPVDDFLDEIIPVHRGKIMRWLKQLEKEGPDLPRPYADHVEGNIRELRIAISHHQYRLLYFFHGKTIVITQGFLKKTNKISQEEITRAHKRMHDWICRYGSG